MCAAGSKGVDVYKRQPTTDENYKKGVTMTLDKAAKALDALHVEELSLIHIFSGVCITDFALPRHPRRCRTHLPAPPVRDVYKRQGI